MRCLPCIALLALTWRTPVPRPNRPNRPRCRARSQPRHRPVRGFAVPPRGFDSAGAFAVESDEGLAACARPFATKTRCPFRETSWPKRRSARSNARRRQDAEHRRYLAIVPAQGFALANYDLGERRLVLRHGPGFQIGRKRRALTKPGDKARFGFRCCRRC